MVLNFYLRNIMFEFGNQCSCLINSNLWKVINEGFFHNIVGKSSGCMSTIYVGNVSAKKIEGYLAEIPDILELCLVFWSCIDQIFYCFVMFPPFWRQGRQYQRDLRWRLPRATSLSSGRRTWTSFHGSSKPVRRRGHEYFPAGFGLFFPHLLVCVLKGSTVLNHKLGHRCLNTKLQIYNKYMYKIQ